MKEIWKDIKDYEGLYQVSNLGRIKRLERIIPTKIKNNEYIKYKEKILKNVKSKAGYNYIGLSKNHIVKRYRVCRLVAETFILNKNNYPCVNHKDENKLNDKVENLEWCTYKYNNDYGNRKIKCNEKRKKVVQYSKENKIIKVWSCVSQAEKQLKIYNIKMVINGTRKYAGGYIWKYENNFRT